METAFIIAAIGAIIWAIQYAIPLPAPVGRAAAGIFAIAGIIYLILKYT